MAKFITVLGLLGIVVGISAIAHALLSSSGTLVFAITINIAFLLCGISVFAGISRLKKGLQSPDDKARFTLVILQFFFVLVVILVNVMIREELYRTSLLAKPLEKVLSLQGRSYEWKREEFSKENFPEGRHYGVIAQELEKVLPGLVVTRPDGKKAVAYYEIVPILIEAVKEQQKIIDEQRKEIGEIKAMLLKMKK